MRATALEGTVIGIDIGGTNLVVAAVSTEGGVLARATGPTLPRRGPEDGVRRIVALVESVTHEVGDRKPLGIGIGCTGPIDRVAGRVHNPYTLPTWDDFALTDHLQAALDLPVVLENDAHVGALGEHWCGAGRGTRHMVYITVGTGVGGGIILDGKLYTGTTGTAGEVGHHSVDMNGPECYCGRRGCVEMYAAAPGMAKRARELLSTQESLIPALTGPDPAALTPKVIAEAARQGDPVAREVIQLAAQALAEGLANLAILLVPEVMVLGGGVMGSFDLFKPAISQTLDRMVFPLGDLRIVRAELGMSAGVIGAARALLDRSGY